MPEKSFYGERNEITRIDVFEEVDTLAEAALRSFFRRLGASHLLDEVVLPLLGEGDSQIVAAVRDRPRPPRARRAPRERRLPDPPRG